MSDEELAIDGCEGGGEDDEEDEDGGEADREAQEDPSAREVKWGLPEGLTVAEKPTKLDDALLGMVILMRWAAPHGWAVGKISNQITASTPRLFKNFNYRCTWTDGWTNTLLKLDEYKGGASAPYGSWVLLEKASPSVGPSDMQE